MLCRLLQDLDLGGLLQDLGFRYKEAEVLEGVTQVNSSLSLQGVVHVTSTFIRLSAIPSSVFRGLDDLLGNTAR